MDSHLVQSEAARVDGGASGERPTSVSWDRWALFCLLATAATLAATVPHVESPVNDDFSYSRTAFDLARTGRLTYNGWAAAMLGAQAYWGALFVRVLGESFLALRLSTVILAVWSAGLLYSLHRRAGLSPGLATFGTLLLTLSPLFIPNACTFMTDVPALFLFLLSIYGCVRLAETLEGIDSTGTGGPGPVPTRAWLWVGFAVGCGVLGGSVRQTNFIVPAIGPALVCWLRRDRVRLSPQVVAVLALSVLVTVGCAVGLTSWFHAQPYAIHERLSEGVREFFRFRPVPLVIGLLKLGLTFAAVIVPLMWVFPTLWRRSNGVRFSVIRPWAIGLTCFAPAVLLFLPHLEMEGRDWYFPWMGNSFGAEPYLSGGVARPPGDVPLSLPLPVFKVFSVIVLGLIGGSVVHLLLSRPWRWMARTGAGTSNRSPVLVLWCAFAVFYLPLLLLKVFVPHSYGIWDRYLLPLMPLATIGVLDAYQRLGRRRMPVGAWVVLFLLAGYGVAQTHDYFSQLRARLATTDWLENRGIERQRILGGFEYDGWTQIALAGYYNDPRIVHPTGAYRESSTPVGFKTRYWMWRRHAPRVQPDYVVVLSRHSDLFDTDVPAREWVCWLPPFRRTVAVQAVDPKFAQTATLPGRPGRKRSE